MSLENKSKIMKIIAIVLIGIGLLIVLRTGLSNPSVSHTDHETKYTCAMHPGIISDGPGKCPICHMDLIPIDHNHSSDIENMTKEVSEPTTKKILYYRHPMGKNVTSPVPAKDEMGMDYIPVFEDEVPGTNSQIIEGRSSFSLNGLGQQLIGLKKRKVTNSELYSEIKAAGRVAYDPELFAALHDYQIAAKSLSDSKESSLSYVKKDAASLLKAMKTKLLIMGFNEEQINEFAKKSEDLETLLLPTGKAWIYAEIYEYEVKNLKIGDSVIVTSTALPDQKFTGEIMTIGSVVNPTFRTVQIRARVDDPDKNLLPDMYITVSAKTSLGNSLIIPEDAVIRSNNRAVVFVISKENLFSPRLVTLGSKGDNYFQVFSGLTMGEEIVSSANFLIDSESRIQAVIAEASANTLTETKKTKASINNPHNH